MITNLRLQHFRSYKDESFEFEPGVNIIVGPNGSGKTNLLEAILAISTGSSYRVGDSELLAFGEEWARLDATVGAQTRTLKLMQENGRTNKSYIFDEKPYKILTQNHILPVVLFEPDNLQLLTGQPELRRAYLDNLLEQITPGFQATRRHYRRALSQRNALLKSVRKPAKDQLFIWNLRLSELGGSIARARQELITTIAEEFTTLYAEIAHSDKTKATIRYISKLPAPTYESALLSALEQTYEQDIARGFTSYGPHRDDFMISLDERPASEVASRGETRTALLALKVYELGMLERQTGKKPLLLLDDVFSELDGRRRHALASFLQTHQVFITTTDADLVLDDRMQSSNIIPLNPDA